LIIRKFTKARQFVELLRVKQYVKNVFIFAPLFFASEIDNLALLLDTVVAFVAFSLAASGVYLLNDCLDIAQDREHPTKKRRPITSGAISVRFAIVLSALLFVLAGLLMAVLSLQAAGFLGAYLLLNIAYSSLLKHIAILDVGVIATGFVLRLFVGAAVTKIELTIWIVIITFLLALFMALAKRRNDVLLFANTGAKARKVIDGYNLQFLDSAMAIMGSVVIVSYVLYTTSAEILEKVRGSYLYLTALFVIFGILRYMQIVLVDEDGGSPTEIFWKDRFIQLNLLCWVIVFGWILYS
jgi:4-hydroxybenzoate polyprenyltransferase